jgi:copper resistance protein C
LESLDTRTESRAVVSIADLSKKILPALSKIQVFDISGQEVDKRDVKIDKSNAALLTVSLSELKPAKYKVLWRAVSVDTHVTTGSFTFELL